MRNVGWSKGSSGCANRPKDADEAALGEETGTAGLSTEREQAPGRTH